MELAPHTRIAASPFEQITNLQNLEPENIVTDSRLASLLCACSTRGYTSATIHDERPLGQQVRILSLLVEIFGVLLVW